MNRNLVLGGIAALLILTALGYTFLRPSVSADIPDKIAANCGCLVCRKQVRITAGVLEQPPYVCPECGERAAYPLMECRDCGKHFVPNLQKREGREFPVMPIAPSCPSCGSMSVQAYAAPETVPAEDLVLPAWPQ